MNKVCLLGLNLITFFSIVASAKSESLTISTDESLKNAAYVDYVEYVKGQDQDLKIFSVSGGDPAMNGTHLNLAVFSDVQTGWNVFELANVSTFKLVQSTKKGYLKLNLVKDNINSEGTITKESSVLYINLQNIDKGLLEVEEIKK